MFFFSTIHDISFCCIALLNNCFIASVTQFFFRRWYFQTAEITGYTLYGLFKWKRTTCAGFFFHLFILKIQLSRRCVIQLIGLTPPELCACPKPGYVSPTPKVVVFYIVFNDLRWEVSTRVVDIGGMGFLAITVWTIFS